MSHRYIIAIDSGTSSTKTVLWDERGRLIAEASAPHTVHRPQPAWAEVDARQWWGAACETIQAVLAQADVNPRDVAGIGVDGIGWVLLGVDANCVPLHPALIWLDRRAEAEAAELRKRPDAAQLIDLTANPLDAAYVTPKLLWLQRHHPDIYDQTYKFLPSSGYLVAKLTGVFSCDTTQAYGYHCFDMRRAQWDTDAAQQLGIDAGKLPTLYPPTEIVGQMTEQAASETGLVPGIPVIAGGLDATIGAFGAGALAVGETVDQGGQAGGMLMCVDRVLVEPRLIFAHHVLPGRYYLQSGTVGGGVLGWFRDVLGHAELNAASVLGDDVFALISRQVEQTLPGAGGLLFLPYMAGERTPLWNSDARGVFFGLSYSTTRGEMLRALMEGAAFAVYHNLRIAEQQGVTVSEWIGNGGAARSDVWNQIKADITNKPFVLKRQADGRDGGHTLGLYAMVAGAVGLQDDLAAAIENLLPQRKVYTPDAARHAMYDDLFGVYLDLSDKLLENFGSLADVTRKHAHILTGGSENA